MYIKHTTEFDLVAWGLIGGDKYLPLVMWEVNAWWVVTPAKAASLHVEATAGQLEILGPLSGLLGKFSLLI